MRASTHGSPTERQATILAFVASYQAEHGYPPTRREISQQLGWLSLHVLTLDLQALARGRQLQIVPRVARGIRVLS